MTASLNLLLGYPVETELDLVPPVTEMEDISLTEASGKAMAVNPEVVEAESNVVSGEIKWNFTKFLIARNGQPIARFEPAVMPDSPQVMSAIESALKP
jgi:glutathione peroxidase-family protein